MKPIALLLIALLCNCWQYVSAHENCHGKCTGKANCTACSNCSKCKYCNSGGTCGVCAGTTKEKKATPKPKEPESSQCKATTKKGTRCSRNARSGGYCWQHGGK